MDLTKITTPFGLLDEATQKALRECGGPYEWWTEGKNGPVWRDDNTPEISFKSGTIAIRLKPQPPKPREWWIWRDGRGTVNGMFLSKTTRENVHFLAGDEIIHVREVIEP